MIERLETAGLGFYAKSIQTKERLGTVELIEWQIITYIESEGKIPLRELVYRVHELPPSMMSLILDFGSLDSDTEKRYIREMVINQVSNLQVSCMMICFCSCKISSLPIQKPEKMTFSYDPYIDAITDILSWSQEYMRKKKVRFVNLNCFFLIVLFNF